MFGMGPLRASRMILWNTAFMTSTESHSPEFPTTRRSLFVTTTAKSGKVLWINYRRSILTGRIEHHLPQQFDAIIERLQGNALVNGMDAAVTRLA